MTFKDYIFESRSYKRKQLRRTQGDPYLQQVYTLLFMKYGNKEGGFSKQDVAEDPVLTNALDKIMAKSTSPTVIEMSNEQSLWSVAIELLRRGQFLKCDFFDRKHFMVWDSQYTFEKPARSYVDPEIFTDLL